MEYSYFNLLKKDDCDTNFDMNLDFNNVEFTNKIDKKFNEMQGCGVYMKMILRGILHKDVHAAYGHLGTNNAEFEVLEFINTGKVKHFKIKTNE
jgi:hypothetical protein